MKYNKNVVLLKNAIKFYQQKNRGAAKTVFNKPLDSSNCRLKFPAFKSHKDILKTRVLVVYILIVVLFGCSQPPDEEEIDTSTVDVSGMWNYQQITFNPDTQTFITSYFHVGIVENDETIILQQCFNNSEIVFTRSSDILTNSEEQQIKIVSSNTIESMSIPDLWRLTKVKPELDRFHNAGVVTLQSDAIPYLEVTENVCAQRIIQEGSEKLHLKISVPFEESYLDIDLIINDINESMNNVTHMTFTSPSLHLYYNQYFIDTLYGHATIHTLTREKIALSFDVTQRINSIFPGDQIQGTIDIRL